VTIFYVGVGLGFGTYESNLCHMKFITNEIELAKRKASELRKLLKNLNITMEEVFIISCPECSYCGYNGTFNEHICPICSFELTKSKIIDQIEEIKNVKRKSN